MAVYIVMEFIKMRIYKKICKNERGGLLPPDLGLIKKSTKKIQHRKTKIKKII